MPQYTQKQVREIFLSYCESLVDEWANIKRDTVKEQLSGLLFSILAMLDGEGDGLPAFELIPAPHPNDQEYLDSHGKDYWPPLPEDFEERDDIVTVHGQLHLHDIYSKRRNK